MANRPAKNMTSLPSQTMVPTATVFGRLIIGADGDGERAVVDTLPS